MRALIGSGGKTFPLPNTPPSIGRISPGAGPARTLRTVPAHLPRASAPSELSQSPLDCRRRIGQPRLLLPWLFTPVLNPLIESAQVDIGQQGRYDSPDAKDNPKLRVLRKELEVGPGAPLDPSRMESESNAGS